MMIMIIIIERNMSNNTKNKIYSRARVLIASKPYTYNNIDKSLKKD